jgi:hypothetical protein
MTMIGHQHQYCVDGIIMMPFLDACFGQSEIILKLSDIFQWNCNELNRH